MSYIINNFIIVFTITTDFHDYMSIRGASYNF